MTVKLEVLTETWSWEQFQQRTPPYSIALDGFVNEGPVVEHKGPRANFNHHEGCSRLATLATCGQVLMAIRQRLFKLFDKPTTIYVNDCDEDVCTSWFLLKHAHLVASTMNPLVNKLVHLEGTLDATAGAYPYPPELPALHEIAWVFDPYRRFRLSGGLDKRFVTEFRSVIEDVENRILAYMAGRSGKLEPDGRYEKIGGGKGWTMVRELGAQARTQMFADGVDAFVSVRPHLIEGRYVYVIGRMSIFVPFPLPDIIRMLNSLEIPADGRPVPHPPVDPWGGADTVAGSPRQAGSRFPPAEIERIVNETLARRL